MLHLFSRTPRQRAGRLCMIIAFMLVLMVGLTGCSSTKQEAATGDGKQAAGPVTLLNVSYDPTRELYKEFNESFTKYWKDKTGQDVTIKQSHGGSGAQARSVLEGLEADVVTLALADDINPMRDAGLVAPDWEKRLANNSTPYTSTIVFLVRKGNPKNIKDWDDLIRSDVSVITPNPKTSGGARWNHLAAWVYALKKYNNDENQAKNFLAQLYKNVPVLDTGARGATNTFVERGLGDVLIAWENEALMAPLELGKDKFDIVIPSISILAEPSVSVVDKVVDKRGTREIATAYLEYLYSEQGQEIAAKNFYRPRNEAVAQKYANQFPKLNLITIADLGGWPAASKKHFADGGIFDQIYTPNK